MSENRIVTLYNFTWLFIRVLIQIIVNIIFLIIDIINWMVVHIGWLISFVVNFLGPVSNSVVGKINQKELYRILALASSSGITMETLIKTLEDNSDKWISDEAYASFVRAMLNGLEHNYFALTTAVVIFIGDFIRRMYHG